MKCKCCIPAKHTKEPCQKLRSRSTEAVRMGSFSSCAHRNMTRYSQGCQVGVKVPAQKPPETSQTPVSSEFAIIYSINKLPTASYTHKAIKKTCSQ